MKFIFTYHDDKGDIYRSTNFQDGHPALWWTPKSTQPVTVIMGVQISCYILSVEIQVRVILILSSVPTTAQQQQQQQQTCRTKEKGIFLCVILQMLLWKV